MGTLWHRFLRTISFVLGVLLAGAMFVFAYSNTGRTTIDWNLPGGGLSIHTGEVVIWWLVLVPLVLGLLFGYLYALPVRFHHYAQHMRHRRRVHELEKEVQGLKVMLDRVREMPEDGPQALAPAAAEAPLEGEASLSELAPEAPEEWEAPAPAPEPEPVQAGAGAQPAAERPPSGDGNRRRARRAKLSAPPQS